jgi:vancomycin resistance protein YoaR
MSLHMTTTTPDAIAVPTTPPRGRRTKLRFAVAFLIGLVATLALGTGALYAFDQQYAGRILPGVRIGGLDLSGLDPVAAADRVRTEYASLGEGQLVLSGPDGTTVITYAQIGRGPDVEAMVAEAMAIGRDGGPIERVIADARTALRGATVEPRVTFDPEALSAELGAFAESLAVEPRDAEVVVDEDDTFKVNYAANGRQALLEAPLDEALAAITALDAPSRVEVTVPTVVVPPVITTDEARDALSTANRLTAGIALELDEDEKRTISAARLRGWVTFGPTADGGYAATLDTSKLPDLFTYYAKEIDRSPVNASYTASNGKITGVTKSRNGRTLDVEATVAQVRALLDQRLAGVAVASVAPTFEVIEPALTTAEAEAARPKMRKISSWTTYFPVSEKNGFGANIWIPARIIDGYVVAPRATFDFWKAVGPVTRAKGYRDGGAIINGKTEPQGALAGGICSCSTTLFNAALRAGYDMGARRNHYYYIDRYPLGLDATVFISASGSVQTMSFTNDTDYPILIRGTGWSNGGDGYVRFELYSVPNGRKVTFSKPIVKNVRKATDTVQYTTALAPGVAQRVEYPVDGKQVTVTRTVRDRNGKVIHTDTYYSNYARITGLTLIGRAD